MQIPNLQWLFMGILQLFCYCCDMNKWERYAILSSTSTIIKFSSRKDSQQMLRKKKQLHDIDSNVLHLLQGTKLLQIKVLYPYYRGISNQYKRVEGNI